MLLGFPSRPLQCASWLRWSLFYLWWASSGGEWSRREPLGGGETRLRRLRLEVASVYGTGWACLIRSTICPIATISCVHMLVWTSWYYGVFGSCSRFAIAIATLALGVLNTYWFPTMSKASSRFCGFICLCYSSSCARCWARSALRCSCCYLWSLVSPSSTGSSLLTSRTRSPCWGRKIEEREKPRGYGSRDVKPQSGQIQC